MRIAPNVPRTSAALATAAWSPEGALEKVVETAEPLLVTAYISRTQLLNLFRRFAF